MREVQRDVDGTCDAVAAPLAELFSVLSKGHTLCSDVKNAELALYAPAFCRYGLLSFCACPKRHKPKMMLPPQLTGRRYLRTHQTQTPAESAIVR